MTNNTNNTNNTESDGNHQHGEKCRVVIIGAGASGLQCAQKLLSHNNMDPSEIIILEAKDRIGGRVYTSSQRIPLPCSSDGYEDICMDEGAAWVHGTGTRREPNPLVSLIAKGGGTIVPVAPFNTGTEPRKMHSKNPYRSGIIPSSTSSSTSTTSTSTTSSSTTSSSTTSPSFLTLYYNGKELPTPTIPSEEPTIVDYALRFHERRMDRISDIGKLAYETGEGMMLSAMNLTDALAILEEEVDSNSSKSKAAPDRNMELFQKLKKMLISRQYDDDDDDDCEMLLKAENKGTHDSNIIPLISGFYLYLLETWHGTSIDRLPLDEFVEWDDEESDESDPEDDRDDNAIHHQNGKGSENNDEKDEDDADCYDPQDGSFPGPHCIVSNGGMSTVIQTLSQNGVKETIRLNEEVTSIQIQMPNKKVVKVKCESGLEVEADVCICTISLGCLQASQVKNTNDEDKSVERPNTGIRFHPSLSDDKVKAIQTLQMGAYKKVFLTFDRIFWPVDKPFLGLIRNNNRESSSSDSHLIDLGNYLAVDNLWAHRGLPCLEVTLVGRLAQNAYKQPDHVVQNSVMQFIYDAMIDTEVASTSDLPKCVQCHVTRWEEDSFTRGAYSYYACNATERHYDALRKVEWGGRLIFAGEATDSEYQGSLHAAILSGMNAAEKAWDVLDV